MGPLMLDVQGCELDAEEREILRHPTVGGVILFGRNYHDRSQLSALVKTIRQAANKPLLIAVDHEGGRVQRFLTGFTRLPPMQVLGALWEKSPEAALDLAHDVGEVLATELRASGVDLSFCNDRFCSRLCVCKNRFFITNDFLIFFDFLWRLLFELSK